ncbi:hypothetical protein HOLleu_16557 [Holothuria leucospilota]|uniref:G-protein coupled receptors family 1 profile domain-containing protein n=1 Tax=Holothuria leucospilota TaxID=206669 RepID=A0A9Q1H7W4_HOLLE|nr:hypothetical protein HOLleu_16557 [Holothuria leucospilota]
MDDVVGYNQTAQTTSPKYRENPTGWDSEEILYLKRIFELRLVVCTLGFVINIILLILQIKIRSFGRTQYVFAMILTISDIIHAADVFGETFVLRKTFKEPAYWFGAIAFASGLLSYLSIVAVAVDRYLALCAIPFKYKQVVTIKRYWLVIAIMFVFSITCSYIFLVSVSYKDLHLTYISLIVSTTLITLTCTVYIRLAYLVSISLRGMKLPVDIKRQRHTQTTRLMIAFATILGANIVFNMPQNFFGVYIVLQPPGNRYNVFKHLSLGNWMYNVQTINTCANPLIFWHQVLVKEIQLPLFSTFCKDSRTPNSQSTISGCLPSAIGGSRSSSV